ncbi:MAG: hypothetical protein LBE62_09070 [Azonexus sp.]|nr:hypothetical protein [Azonexus sp.]
MSISLPIPSELLAPVPLTGKSPALALWVRKTPNLFRGVLELDCSGKTVEAAAVAVRDTVTAEYSPGFIIPFAFGAVLHYDRASPNAADVAHLIDDRARSRATWQWIIVVNDSSKRVYGVHMWMRGYLTPVYETLIGHFENTGYLCQCITKEPGRFWLNYFKLNDVLGVIGAIVIVVGLLRWLFF